MIHSEACTNLVAEFEGYRSHAYPDDGGVPTIGYGHTNGVKMGDVCTPSQALGWLDIDLHEADEGVERCVKIPLKQYEWDALCSFVFNVGWQDLHESTLLIMLNANGNREAIAGQFERFDKVKGKPDAGVLTRRQKEAKLFLNELGTAA